MLYSLEVTDSYKGLSSRQKHYQDERVPSTVGFAHYISSTQYDSMPLSNGENSLGVVVRVVQVGSQRAVLQVEDLHTFIAGLRSASAQRSYSDEMRYC